MHEAVLAVASGGLITDLYSAFRSEDTEALDAAHVSWR